VAPTGQLDGRCQRAQVRAEPGSAKPALRRPFSKGTPGVPGPAADRWSPSTRSYPATLRRALQPAPPAPQLGPRDASAVEARRSKECAELRPAAPPRRPWWTDPRVRLRSMTSNFWHPTGLERNRPASSLPQLRPCRRRCARPARVHPPAPRDGATTGRGDRGGVRPCGAGHPGGADDVGWASGGGETGGKSNPQGAPNRLRSSPFPQLRDSVAGTGFEPV
jgi:hypothetical protein